jgi:hypothetical protein
LTPVVWGTETYAHTLIGAPQRMLATLRHTAAGRPGRDGEGGLMAAIKELQAQDRRRLRNGGAGYRPNSWQDIQDREEMDRAAEREQAKADDSPAFTT